MRTLLIAIFLVSLLIFSYFVYMTSKEAQKLPLFKIESNANVKVIKRYGQSWALVKIENTCLLMYHWKASLFSESVVIVVVDCDKFSLDSESSPSE